MTQIFRTNVPGKTQCGKTGATSFGGFYYYTYSEYNNFWAPDMVGPTEKIIAAIPLSLGDKKYG